MNQYQMRSRAYESESNWEICKLHLCFYFIVCIVVNYPNVMYSAYSNVIS